MGWPRLPRGDNPVRDPAYQRLRSNFCNPYGIIFTGLHQKLSPRRIFSPLFCLLGWLTPIEAFRNIISNRDTAHHGKNTAHVIFFLQFRPFFKKISAFEPPVPLYNSTAPWPIELCCYTTLLWLFTLCICIRWFRMMCFKRRCQWSLRHYTTTHYWKRIIGEGARNTGPRHTRAVTWPRAGSSYY
jgi:hypothetical protein